MFEKQILRQLFTEAEGMPFAVTYWDKETDLFGKGKPKFTIYMNDQKILDTLKRDVEIGFGDAYVEGKWDIDGDISDVMAVAASTLSKRASAPAGSILRAATNILGSASNRRSTKRQIEDVQRHYDLGNDFYKLWLDESMCYSCAYFKTPEDSLEIAQKQKIEHSLTKLRLKKGETMLDIGSGWGALLVNAAWKHEARTLGITLSKEQYEYACEKIQALELQNLADVRLLNYQNLSNTGAQFDKIVSIGMIEHVGKPHLAEFTKSVAKMLRPGGLALLHFITTPCEGQFDAWLDKYIFPGAYIPTLPEMLKHFAANNLRVLDIENLRPHYRLTLDHWSDRFESHVDEIRQMLGNEFVRMWRLYLRGSSAGFRIGSVELHQVLISNGLTENEPLTRSYMYI